MFQLLASMAAGFLIGLVTRFILEQKSRKKMLKMENEMLKNHSRILSLQQKISFIESANAATAK